MRTGSRVYAQVRAGVRSRRGRRILAAVAAMGIGVDSGGTFTDAVAVAGGGVVRVAKVPSTPDDPARATAAACAAVAAGEPAGELRHGTTVPTNALLERSGARTALVTTAGFEDVLEIGRQRRPDLYDIDADRPEALVPAAMRFGLRERLDHRGGTVVELTPGAIAEVCSRVDATAAESVAVCLLHSYADGSDEREMAAALARPGRVVTLSSVVAPELREFERTSTAVLHAYLGPGTAAYLDRLAADPAVPDRVLVMRSAGGLAEVATLAGRPADALLSGPAAGALAAAAVATAAGFPDALAFDMGGTSTDVCLIQDGRPEMRSLTLVGGLPCLSPALAVHTVGAGGGSIAALDPGGALRVGPRSSGADPGPASYGRGGTAATVTDADVVLGRITRLVGGELTLDESLAHAALAALGDHAAEAVVDVVDAAMERALREVSVYRGVDPAACVLVAFGGAGGLHAAALARALGCRSVLVPPLAGVLSAVGLLAAPVRADRSRTVVVDLADLDLASLEPLRAGAGAEVGASGDVVCELAVDCRYAGQSHELRVVVHPGDDVAAVVERFHSEHEVRNGYRRDGAPVQVVTLRASAEVPSSVDVASVLAAARPGPGPGTRGPTAWRGPGGIIRWDRSALTPGFRAEGPCAVDDVGATTWVPAGFVVGVDDALNLVLEPR